MIDISQKNFYITTTLPYVNAKPHVGFAMELVRSDIIARFKKQRGYRVFFNTGTDEHGQKIYQKAQQEQKDPQEYVDECAQFFKDLLPTLGILEDVHFIRTTDKAHIAAAQEFWRRCDAEGDIYKKEYRIKYCIGCELEKVESELADGKCPLHPDRELEIREEENYFFKWSKYQDRLLRHYKEQGDFVIPDFRFNEIKSFVERGLEDFSISRLVKKMPWGVPVPGDDEHVMYVWFDALVNYVSTLGWPTEEGDFEDFWKKGETVQYAGKDNLRQQSAMWQAMLMSAGIPTTKHIVINGFILSDGQKMSKSLGNVIDPVAVVGQYGVEAFRYFVARELSSFEDSDWTSERFHTAYNASLANGLGNLVSRVMKMASAYLSEPVHVKDPSGMSPLFVENMERFEIHRAMDVVWECIANADKLIQEKEPFKLIKTDPENARMLVADLVQELWKIGVMLEASMPETAARILRAVKDNKLETPLFPRIDAVL